MVQLYTPTAHGCDMPLVKQVYDGGSPCDVKDIQRTTEVRYTCAAGQDTVVTSIREVHSCSYQITVATPLICSHTAFHGVQVCFPVSNYYNIGDRSPKLTLEGS